MPITPHFEISQTDDQVLVTISVKTVRIYNVEVLLEESTLHFYASPYLLKLQFAPYQFSDDEQGSLSAEYNPSLQTVRIPIQKREKGVYWANLDLTARLLQPREIPRQWLRAVKDGPSEHVEEETGTGETRGVMSSEFDFTASTGYGFGNLFRRVFVDYCRGGLAQEMLQLPEPETSTNPEKRRLRIEKEASDFSGQRYMEDLYIEEDYLFPMVMSFLPFWEKQPISSGQKDHVGEDVACMMKTFEQQLSLSDRNDHAFTSKEKLTLSTIPYPLIPERYFEREECMPLLLGLLDILVPFCFDHLTTMGDPTVESAWTISTLSCSLSWLDTPNESAEEIVTATFRRMLIYPYWRNFEFACYVWEQVISILQSGVRTIIKCLLLVRSVLEKSESYYVGNKLFVDPYLYWIQQIEVDGAIDSLVRRVTKVLEDKKILKERIGLDLKSLESLNESEEDDSCTDASDADSDSSSTANQESSTSEDRPNTIASTERSSIGLLDSDIGSGPLILQLVDSETQNSREYQCQDSKSLIEELETA